MMARSNFGTIKNSKTLPHGIKCHCPMKKVSNKVSGDNWSDRVELRHMYYEIMLNPNATHLINGSNTPNPDMTVCYTGSMTRPV